MNINRGCKSAAPVLSAFIPGQLAFYMLIMLFNLNGCMFNPELILQARYRFLFCLWES